MSYYTLLGRDAVRALEAWLAVRPESPLDDIFLSQTGTRILYDSFREYLKRRLIRLGLLKQQFGVTKSEQSAIRYGKNPHEFRDAFRTRWRKSGVDVDLAEYLMGHAEQVDPNLYEKITDDVEWMRVKYLEAEKWLNITTEDPEKVDVSDVYRLRVQVEEARRSGASEFDALRAQLDESNRRLSSHEGLLKAVDERTRRYEAARVLRNTEGVSDGAHR